MIHLRQSTASQEIPLGYFVDSTDGNTEETALTIANTDIKIWKTGATTLANKNSGGATHISNGIYYCVLDATDTDTIGPLRVFVHVSGALPVKVDCTVLDEAIYDQMFGTTAFATAAAVAAAVAEEALAGHTTAGTLGKVLSDAGTKVGFLPSATAGAAGGVFIAGTNAATTITTALTTTFTGNLTGSVASVTGAVGSVTGNVGGNVTGSVGSLAAQAQTDVKTQAVAALNTDTYAEPGQGAPAATASLVTKIGYLYKNWRNRKTQTATTWSLYADDATTVDQKATIADDGTTGSKTEIITGP